MIRVSVCFRMIAVALSLAACDGQTVYTTPEQAPKLSGASLVVLAIADVTDHAKKPNTPVDKTIAPGAQSNLDWVRGFAQDVAGATGLTLQMHEVVASDAPSDPFTCANIVQQIKSLNAGPNDTVFVYYSGHGFNFGPRTQALLKQSIVVPENLSYPPSRMPYMYCGSFQGTPNARDALRWVTSSRPRLAIVMYDSCNSYIAGTEAAAAVGNAPSPHLGVDHRLISLFVEARGEVVIAGTQPGHYGFYPNNGGLFTTQFASLLDSLPNKRPTTWPSVLNQLKPMCTIYQSKPYVQVPIYEVDSPSGRSESDPAEVDSTKICGSSRS